MKKLCIMHLFILFGLILNTCSVNSGYNKIEIKYLSTFSSSRMWSILVGKGTWNENRIATLYTLINTGENVLYYIPLLMSKINDFDSSGDYNTDEKNTIIATSQFMSNALNNKNLAILNNDDASINSGINKLVEEFYRLCENDVTFPKLIYTLDNGPFYGIETDLILPKNDSLFLTDINSTIILRGENNINTLELLDNSGNLQWRKILSRLESQYITMVNFVEDPIIDKNGLGYKIGLIGDGEFIHLYLGTDGRFRLFFHSW